jgi:TRAP-type C4-dicarboxylate transport system permease small subunit
MPMDDHTASNSIGRAVALDWTLVVAAFWALAGIVFAQVVARYILGSSIGWSEEIARALLVAITFLGCAIAMRRNTHIAIEVTFAYLPQSAGRMLVTIIDLLKISLSGALTYMSYVLTISTRQKLTSIDVSKAWLYWPITAFLGLMTVYAIVVTVRHWRAGKADISADIGTTPKI